MIPRIIHYCWFGGNPLPELAKKCIESWKKFCPDYEIVEWNEENFDVNCCEYVKDAFKAKKWAFITDYVRLFALVNYGGVYMDTDVEVVRPIDEFLDNIAFSGFQAEDSIPTGIMASEKGYIGFRELLLEYDRRSFYCSNGEINDIANTKYITDYYLKKGLKLNNTKQTVFDLSLYPYEVFCAKSWVSGIVEATEKTYAIHHFAGSWLDDESVNRRRVRYFCKQHLVFFSDVVYKFYKLSCNLLHPRKSFNKLKSRLQNGKK